MSEPNALVLSPRSKLLLELADEVLELCLMTDQRDLKDRPRGDHKAENQEEGGEKKGRSLPYHLQQSIKRKAIKARVVTRVDDPLTPVIAYATFTPVPDKKDPSVTYLEVELYIPDERYPGQMRKVKARPHFQIDGISGLLPLVLTEKLPNGTEHHIPQTHVCLVLKPVGKAAQEKYPIYRVAPLGLGSKERIVKWDNIGDQKRQYARTENDKREVDRDWPRITHMPHAFAEPGKRYLNFTPQIFDCLRKNEQGEPVEGEPFYFGQIYGQKVIDASNGSNVPPETDAQGKDTFFIEQAFEVVGVGENAIYVVWRGRPDQINYQKGVLKIDQYVVDGFSALKTDVFSVDPDSVQREALRWVKGPYNGDNPLYTYALGREEVHVGDAPLAVRNAVSRVANAAIAHIRRELTVQKTDFEGRLSMAQLPSLKEALAGVAIEDVWYRTSGDDDVVANLVKRFLGGTFVWDSWLCNHLRTYVLTMIAKYAEVEPPAKPEKKEASKVEAPVEDAPLPAAEAAPKPKRGGKKTNKEGEASSTPA